jgi:catechol 2,3-dioxygenase-like lactoylglutathione lyase family enzyme
MTNLRESSHRAGTSYAVPDVIATRPRWRGVHHLALVTPDMDATVRFWVGLLGARLVATIATDTFRHYFFEIGPASTVAFFEYLDGAKVEPFAKPAGASDPRAPQFDHLALELPDEDALIALRDRLRSAGCEVTNIVDHGLLRSVYFTDPTGIALEASYWVLDPTGRSADYADPAVFGDPDPVPAVDELERDGRLAWVPTTTLVDSATQDRYQTG